MAMKKSTLAAASAVLIALLALVLWYVAKDTAQQGDQAGPSVLKVTAILPMTGPGSSLGTYANNGIQLAQQEIERRFQGLLKVEVEVIDSKNQAKEAVTALQASMAKSRPDAMISALSSVSSAIKPIVEQQKILTIATTTALSGLPEGTDHLIRVYPTSDNFVRPVAEYMAQHYKRVAVLYVHDDFGDSNYRVFEDIEQATNVDVVFSESYELLQADTRTLIEKLAASNVEAVYIAGYGPAYINIFKNLGEIAPNIAVFADIAFPNPAVIKALGNAAEGVIFDGTDAELTKPTTRAAAGFRKLYAQRFKQDPFMVAGFAYDSLIMLADATMHSGSFSSPDKAAVIALSPFNGIMGRIELSADGECNIPLNLMIRKNGATVPLPRVKHESK